MADKKQPWMKWYPSDWRSETGLRMVSRAARSLWLDMIGLMHEAQPYGELRLNGRALKPSALAKLLGDREAEILKLMAELEVAGVFSRRDDGTIFSRRMIRDKEKSETAQERGEMGGHPDIRRGLVPKELRTRRFRRSDAPVKTARILAKSGGCCHWCRVVLTTETEEDGNITENFFHVDHVIPIKDGGGNEEENLVASCAKCNHERKYDLNREVTVGNSSDRKPQRLEARDQKPEELELSADADVRGPTFDQFWKSYPIDRNMSRKAAETQWKRLNPDKRAAAIAAVPGFKAYCAANASWYRPVHAERFLSQERFEGYAAAPVVGQPDEAAARAAWGGQASKLIDALGDNGHPQFVAWFYDAAFEPGPQPRLTVRKEFVKKRIVEIYMPALKKAFGGEVILEVAA